MKNFIIPIFIPHWGCPHQCVFCSQNQITGCWQPMRAEDVKREIQAGLARLTQQRHVEVAFYGGSFTALPLETQEELLHPAFSARKSGAIQGIRLSTRPDCINNKVLELLKSFAVGTVELGVQSLDDRVLAKSERGHTSAQSLSALELLRREGFYTVAQLMVGLPEEDWESLLCTGKRLVAAKPDAIRIYPTVVLPYTPLAALYERGCYQPLSLNEAILKAAFLKLQAEFNGITVIRVGLQATELLDSDGAIVAGPYHPAFGELVSNKIFYLMVARVLEAQPGHSTLTIRHHPKDHSKIRGLANCNYHQWKKLYGVDISFQLSDDVKKGVLVLNYADARYTINSSILSEV